MKLSSILLGTTLLIGSPGCSTTTNDPSPAPVRTNTGTLTVDWTISNSAENSIVGDFVQPCSDGVTNITLDSGDYAADAALLDGAGAERTTRVNINPFSIHSDADLSIMVDFPANSFH